jgi:hypothetical protein
MGQFEMRNQIMEATGFAGNDEKRRNHALAALAEALDSHAQALARIGDGLIAQASANGERPICGKCDERRVYPGDYLCEDCR